MLPGIVVAVVVVFAAVVVVGAVAAVGIVEVAGRFLVGFVVLVVVGV